MRQDISTITRKEPDSALLHGSTATEAVASLMARCKQDFALYRQLMDPLLKDVCHKAVNRRIPPMSLRPHLRSNGSKADVERTRAGWHMTDPERTILTGAKNVQGGKPWRMKLASTRR